MEKDRLIWGKSAALGEKSPVPGLFGIYLPCVHLAASGCPASSWGAAVHLARFTALAKLIGSGQGESLGLSFQLADLHQRWSKQKCGGIESFRLALDCLHAASNKIDRALGQIWFHLLGLEHHYFLFSHRYYGLLGLLKTPWADQHHLQPRAV